MIDKLVVKNFKSIGEEGIDIELRPLTILIGPNGSGKSTILESIPVLSQTVGDTIPIDNKKQSMVYIPYPIDNIVYKRNDQNCLTFEIYITPNERDIEKLTNIYNKKSEINEKSKGKVKMMESKEKVSIVTNVMLSKEAEIGYSLSYKWKTNEFSQFVSRGDLKIARSEQIKSGENSWKYNLIFLNMPISSPKIGPDRVLVEGIFTPREDQPDYGINPDLAEEIAKIIKLRLYNVHFISAMRGQINFDEKINDYFDAEELQKLGVGVHGQYLIPVISLIYSNRKYEKIYDKICKWSEKFGIEKLTAGWKGKDYLSSEYIDDKCDTILNLAMLNYGSKQILSVITQLFWSKPGAIVLIEEPEISIYSTSQSNLIDLFIDAMSQDKQIILTTHSEFFPIVLQEAIQKGLLNRDDIAIYKINKYKNGTHAQRLKINENGIQGWNNIDDDN